MVRRELGQQCGGQTSADGLPLPHDCDHGAAAVDRAAECARLRGVRRAARDRLPAPLLLAHAAAARLCQVPYHCLLTGLHMESSYFLCSHSEGDDAAVDGGAGVGAVRRAAVARRAGGAGADRAGRGRGLGHRAAVRRARAVGRAGRRRAAQPAAPVLQARDARHGRAPPAPAADAGPAGAGAVRAAVGVARRAGAAGRRAAGAGLGGGRRAAGGGRRAGLAAGRAGLQRAVARVAAGVRGGVGRQARGGGGRVAAAAAQPGLAAQPGGHGAGGGRRARLQPRQAARAPPRRAAAARLTTDAIRASPDPIRIVATRLIF